MLTPANAPHHRLPIVKQPQQQVKTHLLRRQFCRAFSLRLAYLALMLVIRPLARFALLTSFALHPLGQADAQVALAPKDLNTLRQFPVVSSRAEWRERALEIREQVLVSCGLWPMPEKTPLNARVFGRVERDGYSIEKVYLETYTGFFLAGNLYRPLGQGKGPFPAILNPHGHWGNGRMADEKNGCSIAARCINFARQGMIAFSYDMVGYNDTYFADTPTNRSFSDNHRRFATTQADLLWNVSLMGLQTWNSIRALDFLEALTACWLISALAVNKMTLILF